MKILLTVVLILVVLGGVWYLLQPSDDYPLGATPRSATYIVEGRPVTLVNGKASSPAAPGSASTVTTTYFGNEALGDMDGDGVADVATIITQSSGGSGTFYYAVVALHKEDGYRGTNAVLLGDRVAPQPTQVRDLTAIYNYAERKEGEPMTARPSVGVSRYLVMASNALVEKPQ